MDGYAFELLNTMNNKLDYLITELDKTKEKQGGKENGKDKS